MAGKKNARDNTPSSRPLPKSTSSTTTTTTTTTSVPITSATTTGTSAQSTGRVAVPITKTTTVTTATPSTSRTFTATRPNQDISIWEVPQQTWNYYIKTTPQHTKLIDVFLAFLVFNGGVQFLYCLVFGTFPFNAFLSGFCQSVGLFVLTVSLRIQTLEENMKEFNMSPERAFADFVGASLLLQFFVITFAN